MPRLYRSTTDLQHWFLYDDATGWMKFPARTGGWTHRRPLRTGHELDLREVPLWLSFNTGLPIAARQFHHAA
jgi:hypothetical protein